MLKAHLDPYWQTYAIKDHPPNRVQKASLAKAAAAA
jgi:hypothetical protein